MSRLNELVKGVELENEELKNKLEEIKIDTEFEETKLENYLGDEIFYKLNKYNAIIAGGSITSLFSNNEINDIDVYFRTKEDTAGFLQEMFEHTIVSHTKKATLFRYKGTGEDGTYRELSIQAIHYSQFDSAQDIFNSFDFTVCMGAYDFKTNEFVFDKNFLKHNSQRILKFNKGTSFPLMSLLRVRKYTDKYYKISKSEMVRIAMTCMTLNIESYSELKEQLGGLYGVNLDKVFPSDNEEEFDIAKAIDKLSNLHLDESYFIKPISEKFKGVDDLIENALGLKPRYFVFNDEKYRVTWNDLIDDDTYDMKDNAVEIDISEWFGEGIVYKYVKQDNDGKLTSFHDSSFEYKLNEEVEAKGSVGLFMGKEGEIKSFYKDHDNSILLKCKVKVEDFNGMHNGYPTFKKCIPLETVGGVYKAKDVDPPF